MDLNVSAFLGVVVHVSGNGKIIILRCGRACVMKKPALSQAANCHFRALCSKRMLLWSIKIQWAKQCSNNQDTTAKSYSWKKCQYDQRKHNSRCQAIGLVHISLFNASKLLDQNCRIIPLTRNLFWLHVQYNNLQILRITAAASAFMVKQLKY